MRHCSRKKNKHTKKFTETLQRIVDHHTNLFFHIFLIAIPTPLSLHAPSKIIANFSSSSAASNSPPLWVPLTLSISSSLSSCHLAHFRRKCFASSTSCPLHSLHFLSSLPSPFHLPVSMRSCAVPPLSLVTILLTSLLSICALLPLQSLSTIILSTSSFGFSFISCSQDALTSLHAQLFNISFSWKLLSFSTSSSLTSPHIYCYTAVHCIHSVSIF